MVVSFSSVGGRDCHACSSEARGTLLEACLMLEQAFHETLLACWSRPFTRHCWLPVRCWSRPSTRHCWLPVRCWRRPSTRHCWLPVRCWSRPSTRHCWLPVRCWSRPSTRHCWLPVRCWSRPSTRHCWLPVITNLKCMASQVRLQGVNAGKYRDKQNKILEQTFRRILASYETE